jgi:hypothetical protein
MHYEIKDVCQFHGVTQVGVRTSQVACSVSLNNAIRTQMIFLFWTSRNTNKTEPISHYTRYWVFTLKFTFFSNIDQTYGVLKIIIT